MDSAYGFSERVKKFWDSDVARIFGDWYDFHNSTSQRGISHDEYNKLLRQEFKEWFAKHCAGTKSYSRLSERQAKGFLAFIKNLPADHKIAQFNAAIRAEAEMAAALGQGLYKEIQKKHRNWTPKQIAAQVKKELPDLVRKGAQTGKLASTIQRLKGAGYISSKVAIRLGALGVLVAVFYDFEPSKENIRELVVGCSPAFGALLIRDGYGALYMFAKGSLDDSVVTTGMGWMDRAKEDDFKKGKDRRRLIFDDEGFPLYHGR